LQEKREKDLISLQESISKKQEEQLIENAKELEFRKIQFEEQRNRAAEKEKNFFSILGNADQILQTKNYEEAISEYQKALKFIKELGPGWDTYVSNINNTISNIQKMKSTQLTKQIQAQEKLEKREKVELDFQKQITNLLNKEREQLKQKEIVLKDKEKEITYLAQRKDVAFELLDTAAIYVRNGNYEDAIVSYQNAGNIFAEIQWNDELPLIEKSINEIEEMQREQNILKQKKMEETIQRQKEDDIFQKQVSNYLQLEREKLKKKQVEFKEREKELKYREEKRETGFKLLDEAQSEVKQGAFDKAVEILHYAISFFADAHWQNEINLIQNYILEIEDKKREVVLEKQIKLQAELEREKQEKEFQEQVLDQIKIHQENLRRKKIILRENEKELSYRENKKEEAFNLLDNSQKLLSLMKYDEALEIYYNVLNLFAQIQWEDEIPILQEAIKDIENKKREDILLKQKQLEKAIKKEASDRAFFEQIKYRREREKAEILQNQELMEKEKRISTQHLTIQNEAFGIIEIAEDLIQNESYDEAIVNYQKAINMLENIGWEKDYLKLLEDTIENISTRKLEKEKTKQIEFELSLKQQKEEERFQKKISEYLSNEQKKLMSKQIVLEKQEELLKKKEKRRLEAFDIMDKAEELLNQGQYELSIEKYRQSELILNEIGFPTEVVKEMIFKIQDKRREVELNKFKEAELILKRDQEDLIFQQQISERVKIEQQKMKEKQERLKKEEEDNQLIEIKKEEAFNLLENAQTKIKNGEFDEAIGLYQNTTKIFTEIHWDNEIQLIQNSINTVENRKREAELRKQIELEAVLEEEKIEKEFQDNITREMTVQREKLIREEILIKEKEKELAYREEQKDIAFSMLDKAQEFLLQGNYDESLKLYYDVARIFAQIQWVEEISIIQEAIRDIENKRRENDLLKQKSVEKALEDEKANYAFIEQIKQHKEYQKVLEIREMEVLERQKQLSSQNLFEQQKAFKLIEEGDVSLKQNNFDKALKEYNQAVKILTQIGWTGEYLKLLYETINKIENRKSDILKEQELKQTLTAQQEVEERKFQAKISESIQKEKKRLETKQIEIQKREGYLKLVEKHKDEAFKLMDNAEKALNIGHYEQAINVYHQAELMLNEIGFPTGSVKEMIEKIQDKNRKVVFDKQKELEAKLTREREERKFQQIITESIRLDDMKSRVKQEELGKKKESYDYMEKRKGEAFDLLEEAEIFLNQLQYDKALEYYHSAELILNEIAFPTDIIRETIQKVQERRKEQAIQKQKDLELQLLKEREEWELQQKLAKNVRTEKERLQTKQILIEEIEHRKKRFEQRKQEAFRILEEAESSVKDLDYNKAINNYRKAELILNELQFPTESIANMITKVKLLQTQKVEMEEIKYQRELEKLQEEKELKTLIEERQRQEREKKKAHLSALQEREKFIQDQMGVRESAYSLLDDARNYLKQLTPDYNKAISLYVQARNILAENIGWEPEINNLNALIKDLQQEEINFHERKRMEEQARLQRQKEYDLFQEEVRVRKLEQEKLKREQERQYRELVLSQRRIEQIKDEGLKSIDEGKKWAAYHDFEKAYQNFEEAISKFKEIGWIEEIKYIETEIENAKVLEEGVKAEDSKIHAIQEQLERQRYLEERRRESEEAQLKQTVGEVSTLADDVIHLIEERRKELKLSEKEQKARMISESKEFRKKMGDLIKIKEELINELEEKEIKDQEIQEKLQQAKEREEVDNLKRMIEETGKNKKK
jgi:hypothetical protein